MKKRFLLLLALAIFSLGSCAMLSDDNVDLKKISVEGGRLEPAFDPAITDYTVLIDSPEALEIKVKTLSGRTLCSPDSSASRSMNADDSDYAIHLLAPSGRSRSYHFNFARSAESAPVLAGVQCSGAVLQPAFEAGVTDYQVQMDFFASRFDFEAKTPGPGIWVQQQEQVNRNFQSDLALSYTGGVETEGTRVTLLAKEKADQLTSIRFTGDIEVMVSYREILSTAYSFSFVRMVPEAFYMVTNEFTPHATPNGSKAAPFSDLNRAMDAASAAGVSEVRISKGRISSYAMFNLVPGVSLSGGYHFDPVSPETGWNRLPITTQADRSTNATVISVSESSPPFPATTATAPNGALIAAGDMLGAVLSGLSVGTAMGQTTSHSASIFLNNAFNLKVENNTFTGHQPTEMSGIYLFKGGKNLISNNTLVSTGSTSSAAISLFQSAENLISGNTVTEFYTAGSHSAFKFSEPAAGNRLVGNNVVATTGTNLTGVDLMWGEPVEISYNVIDFSGVTSASSLFPISSEGNSAQIINNLLINGDLVTGGTVIETTQADFMLFANTIVGNNFVEAPLVNGDLRANFSIINNIFYSPAATSGTAMLMMEVGPGPHLATGVISNNAFCNINTVLDTMGQAGSFTLAQLETSEVTAAGNLSKGKIFSGRVYKPDQAIYDHFSLMTGGATGVPRPDLDGRLRPEGEPWCIGAYEVKPPVYTVSVSAGEFGTFKGANKITAYAGTSISMQALPDGYSEFSRWYNPNYTIPDFAGFDPAFNFILTADTVLEVTFTPPAFYVHPTYMGEFLGKEGMKTYPTTTIERAIELLRAHSSGEAIVKLANAEYTLDKQIPIPAGTWIEGGYSDSLGGRVDWDRHDQRLLGGTRIRLIGTAGLTGAKESLPASFFFFNEADTGVRTGLEGVVLTHEGDASLPVALVHAANGASPLIRLNSFIHNTAGNQTMIFARGGSPKIEMNHFTEVVKASSVETYYAIRLYGTQNPVVYSNFIIANSSQNAFGVHCIKVNNLKLLNNTMRFPSAGSVSYLFLQDSFDSQVYNNLMGSTMTHPGGAAVIRLTGINSRPKIMIANNLIAKTGDPLYMEEGGMTLSTPGEFKDLDGFVNHERNLSIVPGYANPANGDYRLGEADAVELREGGADLKTQKVHLGDETGNCKDADYRVRSGDGAGYGWSIGAFEWFPAIP